MRASHDQNPPEWAGEQTKSGLNAVVHPFGVVRDCKLGGVSESSELSEQARVVAEENEYENGRMTGANSSKKGVNCALTSVLHGHSAAHRANLEPESPRASGSQSNTTRVQMVRPRAHPTALGLPRIPSSQTRNRLSHGGHFDARRRSWLQHTRATTRVAFSCQCSQRTPGGEIIDRRYKNPSGLFLGTNTDSLIFQNKEEIIELNGASNRSRS